MTEPIHTHHEIVVFAGLLGRYPTATLQRAAALAIEHGAMLHVLQTRAAVVSRDLTAYEAIETASATLTLLNAAVAWSQRSVPHQLDVVVQFAQQPLDEAVISYALAHRPELVVLAPYEGQSSELVTKIATRARVPVLVVRSPVSDGPALVATDLQDPSYPVLRRADDLISETRSRIALHVLEGAADRSSAEDRLHRLHSATAALARPTDAVFATGETVAAAIVEEARARHADVVVVGARWRPGANLTFDTDVCTEIIRTAPSSVLVTPLPRRGGWSPYV